MREIARAFLGMSLAVVLSGLAASSARAEYLPQYVMGQWNGVWWHWSTICASGTPTGTTYATDTRMHGVGQDCTHENDPIYQPFEAFTFDKEKKGFVTGKDGLPIRIRKSHNEAKVRDLAPNLEARQLKFIPLKKNGGKNGESDEPEDSFQRASKEFTITDDTTALIKDTGGTTRYFRLLVVTPSANVTIDATAADPIRIGQELHPGDGTGVTNAATLDHIFGPRQIILKWNGCYWHVSCNKDFK